MNAQKALNQTIMDLFDELEEEFIGDKSKLLNILNRWARNYFTVVSNRAVINLEEWNHTKKDTGYRTHLVRSQLIQASLEIANQCGFGTEEFKMEWDDRVSYRNVDYRAGFRSSPQIQPAKELELSFVALKRHPTSWYAHQENPDEWLKAIAKG